MNNPLADPYFVLNAVYSGGKYLKQALSETPLDRNYLTRTVKICYGVLENDIYLSHIIRGNCARNPRSAPRLILKISLYMLEFLRTPRHVVAYNAVALSKKLGKEGESGFLNAFLRAYKIPPLPQNPTESLSVRTSAPLWLAKRVKRSYKEEAESILSAKSLGLCVRFTRGEQKYLAAEHVDTPFEKTYIFPRFTRDEGFFAGDYTFQSVGSAAICDIVGPCALFLDACAAPGGKSVALSTKCGEIYACDVYPHRVELIRSYTQRMGVKNVRAEVADGRAYREEFDGLFDGVLCDCPCSGTGVINENPDIKLFRKEEDIAALAKIQADILNNCARYLKKGGVLYYSTCSILPEENDSAVYNFLSAHPDFSLKTITSPLAHRRTAYGLQFLPDISLGAGFFISAMTKL